MGYLPFTPDGAKLFFQLINLRYEKNQPLLQKKNKTNNTMYT
ncbi:hypothetical protein ACULLB_16675 [Enterococcus gallinarum]